METRLAGNRLRSRIPTPTGGRHPVARALVQRTQWALLAVLLLWLASSATPAHALIGNITVNTLNDDNTHGDHLCTLREAIDNANNAGDITSGDCNPGDVVTFIGFSVSGTIVLTAPAGGALPIGGFVTINGGNAITLSGGNSVRLFYVNPGWILTLQNLTLIKGYSGSSEGGAVYVNGGTLSLNNSTIQDSRTNGFAGGAIYASGGVLTLNNSVVQGNSGYNYGAINSTGAVTLTDSMIQNNVATTGGGALSVGGGVNISGTLIYSNTATTGDGGGIYLTSSGQLRITGSQIDANHAANSGGGGIFSQGVLTLTHSTVTNNTARDGGGIDSFPSSSLTLNNATLHHNSALITGGGIHNEGAATLTDSTLSGNSAEYGGGIYNQSGTATLNNSTLSGNTAGEGGGVNNQATLLLTNVTVSGNTGNAHGGGIINTALATLTNVTLSGNTAFFGSGIFHDSLDARTITLKNTIVANSPMGGNCSVDASSTTNIASSDFNLSSDNTCTAYFNQAGDWNKTSPYLGALTNNGGPTLTRMIFPPSVAIDGGSVCPALDQRGVGRVGAACDIGAVEYQPGVPTPFLWLPLIRR